MSTEKLKKAMLATSSRQNEQVHFSQVRFANPLFSLIFRVVPQRSEERSRHSLENKKILMRDNN
ncbi:MAG: hypothetical protein DRZ90_05915 [Spirochaetes bacterium]|nr:MAG: hypothetical protein DRP49_00705 [Spirochaetota bacterium]RKX97550.1 MAG: hypothetical protein DRZ90_05915 [Spirochaetota bacterium]